jgi:hypothetical protein
LVCSPHNVNSPSFWCVSRPSTQLARDAADRIDGRSLLRYLVSRVQLSLFLHRVAYFDSVGDGAVREHDLEQCILEAIPNIPDLEGLQVRDGLALSRQ